MAGNPFPVTRVYAIDSLSPRESMSPKQNLLPGTLDLLILKILTAGALHGYGIASNIKTSSREVLLVDEGSLYPALQRLRQRGWIAAEWKRTPNNQRARYYTLTIEGRKQLGAQEKSFGELFGAIQRVLRSV
jgi:PadR family transcriptional regulator, regulatory protein PadR